ncbi:MAG TPA: hypothetical protein VFA65_24165 [Bryobacteraceae bacterium]|nr:hypothetical protein [Bryobacteraceae bacterium]
MAKAKLYPETFKELHDWLNGFEDQTDGIPAAICEIGEPYREFFAHSFVRPGDEKVGEKVVAVMMHRQLDNYLSEKDGRIYWRIRLEEEISDVYVVQKYDINGPDMDFITDRKCFADKNWRKVGAFCRLVRASRKAPIIEKAA